MLWLTLWTEQTMTGLPRLIGWLQHYWTLLGAINIQIMTAVRNCPHIGSTQLLTSCHQTITHTFIGSTKKVLFLWFQFCVPLAVAEYWKFLQRIHVEFTDVHPNSAQLSFRSVEPDTWFTFKSPVCFCQTLELLWQIHKNSSSLSDKSKCAFDASLGQENTTRKRVKLSRRSVKSSISKEAHISLSHAFDISSPLWWQNWITSAQIFYKPLSKYQTSAQVCMFEQIP